MTPQDFLIPADVPSCMQEQFCGNYNAITHNTERLLLLTGDQKIEHLNQNFYGPAIHQDANNVSHLFEIAAHSPIGAFVGHLGLIARYARLYPRLNYIVKLNGKTNIMPKGTCDPLSNQLWSVHDVVNFKKQSGSLIRGVGYTVYLGSEHEAVMLREAAQIVFQAHQHGLVAILWMYPRGKHVADERTPELIAGAAGVAASLGADFAKINPPQATNLEQELMYLRIAAQAAGSTKLICAGGSRVDEQSFINTLHAQLHMGGIYGAAIGRNIYQRSLNEAIAYATALSDLVYTSTSAHACFAQFEQLKNKQSV